MFVVYLVRNIEILDGLVNKVLWFWYIVDVLFIYIGVNKNIIIIVNCGFFDEFGIRWYFFVLFVKDKVFIFLEILIFIFFIVIGNW